MGYGGCAAGADNSAVVATTEFKLFSKGGFHIMGGTREIPHELILLRHKSCGLPDGFFLSQHGHRGNRLASAAMSRKRIVAMEFGM